MKKALVFTIVLVAFCLGMVSEGWTQPVRVGAVINLTGPSSSWGQFHAKGHQDYFRYVNEVKGGVGGRKIELKVHDHAYKVPESNKFVKMLCEEKVDMIATWDAGAGLQAKPIVQQYKIPTINYSTFQGLNSPPRDYMFIPFGSYILDSYAVMEYVRSIHTGKDAPKVGILTSNNPYGRAVHAPAKEYAEKNNINIVSVEAFPPDTVDLTTEMLRLKEKGAEYIFLQILPDKIYVGLKAADKINYEVPFIGTWTSTDPDFFKLGKGLIRNRVAMQFCGVLPGDKAWGMKLLEDLWKRYKTVDFFETSYWEGVVVGMVMERAMHRASGVYGKINAETINMAMETFKNEDFGGLIPNITYSKDNHEASFVGRIVQVHENATYSPMTNFFVPGKEKPQILKVLKGK